MSIQSFERIATNKLMQSVEKLGPLKTNISAPSKVRICEMLYTCMN